MKAKIWREKFTQAGDNIEATLAEFAEETRKLVELRTKGSDEKTVGHARDGAIREQKQKWVAFATKVDALASLTFEEVMQTKLTEVSKTHNQWKDKLAGKKEETEEIEEQSEAPAEVVSEPVTEIKPVIPVEVKPKAKPKHVPYGRHLAASLNPKGIA